MMRSFIMKVLLKTQYKLIYRCLFRDDFNACRKRKRINKKRNETKQNRHPIYHFEQARMCIFIDHAFEPFNCHLTFVIHIHL